MSEPLIPLSADDVDDVESPRKKQFLILGGIAGVAVLGVGAFALLSGGGSGDSEAAIPTVHHVVPTATASASPSASSAGEAALPNYPGSVGDRDPFAIPAAVLAAQSAAPAAAGGAAVVGAGASATPAGIAAPAGSVSPVSPVSSASPVAAISPGTLVLPASPGATSPGASPGASSPASSFTLPPSSGSSSPSGASTANSDQYIQLLDAHHTAAGWTVDVRTAAGVAKYVKPDTSNVDGTLFYFQGEDETTGTPTFVFTVGESQGGNLVPNLKEDPATPAADHSTLVLHNGIVDGGLYAE